MKRPLQEGGAWGGLEGLFPDPLLFKFFKFFKFSSNGFPLGV